VEDAMSEELKVAYAGRTKRLATIEMDEYETADGAKDYRVSVRGTVGGLTLQFDTTIDQVREFFQERRRKGEKASLASS
jgi:hypothetical protein